MEKKPKLSTKKIAIISAGAILLLGIIITCVVLICNQPKDKDAGAVDEQNIELPVLNDISVLGENIEFLPDKTVYEVKIPMGNPIIPNVSANAEDGIDFSVYQAYRTEGNDTFSAKIYLDDGKAKNEYEIKFVQDESKGLILQYDDEYKFTPEYQLKDGEKFVFSVDKNDVVKVNENGIVKVIGVSEEPITVNALVGENVVDTLSITKTEKALLNVFIIAGQGNAAGVGGDAETSEKTLPGTAYTVELNDRTNEMKDLSSGRAGFTPALAKKWYGLTGEKVLFLQTAISDVSIKKWASEGEAYSVALDRIELFKEKLNNEDSPYSVKRTVVFWLQGEWDISEGMSSEDYIKCFMDFHNNIKEDSGAELTAIIPVRSSLVTDKEASYIEPVCAAQYQLSNLYDDIIIVSRLSEMASIENGYVQNGNLYYTQNGYNSIGVDCAENLFGYIGKEDNRFVQKIELFGKTHGENIENGSTVQLKTNQSMCTVAVVSPLYAKGVNVSVKYDDKLVNYTSGGVISIAKENTGLSPAQILYECGGVKFVLNVTFVDEEEIKETKKVTYTWEFDDLSEKNKNNIKLSEKSSADGYELKNGEIILKDRKADFSLDKPIELSSDCDWQISWKGTLSDNGILFGKEYDTKSFIYLAPYAEVIKYSIRLVDDTGSTLYLPYEKFADKNKSKSEWEIVYKNSEKTITLYCEGEAVSSVNVESDFKFTFTNMFGRYGSDKVNYCYVGSVDYIKVNIG